MIFIFLSIVEVAIGWRLGHLSLGRVLITCTFFKDRKNALFSSLFATLLNPDILQPLQSSTLLVVLVGM